MNNYEFCVLFFKAYMKKKTESQDAPKEPSIEEKEAQEILEMQEMAKKDPVQ